MRRAEDTIEPFDASKDCPHCWQFWTSPYVNLTRGGDGKLLAIRKRPSAPVLPLPCVYRGEVPIDTVGCRSCNKAVPDQLPVYTCSIHGKCTLTRPPAAKDVTCCRWCPDRKGELIQLSPPKAPVALIPSVAPGRRHLAYHILPVSGSTAWRRGVDQLRLRWSLFTGRKVISVAQGGTVMLQGVGKPVPLEDVEVVRRYLPPDAEVHVVPNDSEYWEGASWDLLWNSLSTVAPEDVILYAHAKGTSRPETINTDRYSSTPRVWTETLYSLSLDYWHLVDEAFRSGFKAVGPMMKVGRAFKGSGKEMEESEFHFAGNFWWVRAGEFRGKIVPLPRHRWASEAWIGLAYKQEEVANLGPWIPHSDLYSHEWWNKTCLPALQKWMESNRPTERVYIKPSPSLSVIVATSGRESLGRTLSSITSQLLPEDELIVKFDASGDWGGTPRQEAIRQAHGSHLLFMDDDDSYMPGAFEEIRRAIRETPGVPLVFKMRRKHDILWREPKVELGNLSTQMICLPNNGRLGLWSRRYQCDFDFMSSTTALYPPDSTRFVDRVICLERP